MSIKFHCEHCGKKIKAQVSASGKWLQCPVCHNKIYVPAPNDGEKLKLKPIDESAEKRERQLMAETFRITQDILKEKEIQNSDIEMVMPTQMSDKELTKTIIAYLRQMADGELDRAKQKARLVSAFGNRALQILDKVALSEMPEPELADIPPQVLSGLIRKLRDQIS